MPNPKVEPSRLEEFEEAVRSRYEEEGGKSLAEEFDVHFYVVANVAKRFGLSSKNGRRRQADSQRRNSTKKWAPVLEIMRKRYETEGPTVLSRELGIPQTTLVTLAKKHGLSAKHNQYEIRARLSKTVNADYFLGPWTPEMAYIVGYIYADGSNVLGQTLCLKCVEPDEEIILDIREELSSLHTPHRRAGYPVSPGEAAQPTTQIQISNHLLVKNLEQRFGVIQRKSYHDVPFPNLPEGHFNHFVRGYFDGDGTTGGYRDGEILRWGLYGTHQFLKGIHDRMLTDPGVSPHQLSRRQGSDILYEVSWYAKSDLQKIYSWIYPSEEIIFLPRKRRTLARVLGIPYE